MDALIALVFATLIVGVVLISAIGYAEMKK
jgi:hypothetical protein